MYRWLLERVPRASVLQDSASHQNSNAQSLFSRGLLGFWPPRRQLAHLILPALILIFLFCGYLRFVNLDWGMVGKKKGGLAS